MDASCWVEMDANNNSSSKYVHCDCALCRYSCYLYPQCVDTVYNIVIRVGVV